MEDAERVHLRLLFTYLGTYLSNLSTQLEVKEATIPVTISLAWELRSTIRLAVIPGMHRSAFGKKTLLHCHALVPGILSHVLLYHGH